MAGDWGYLRGVEARFIFGRTLGHGGSGLVRTVRDRTSGEEFACKSIRKDLREDNQALVRREVKPQYLSSGRPRAVSAALWQQEAGSFRFMHGLAY